MKIHYVKIKLILGLVVSIIASCTPNKPPTNMVVATVEEGEPIIQPEQVAANEQIEVEPYLLLNEKYQKNQLNFLQTHSDVEAVLTWVYLDSYRVSFEYVIRNIPIPDGFTLYCPLASAVLTDNQGNLYPFYELFQRDSKQLQTFCNYEEEKQEYRIYLDYLLDEQVLEGEVTFTPVLNLGGVDANQREGLPRAIPDLGAFEFSVTTTKTEGLTLFPKESKSNNGLIVELDKIEINPIYKSFDICVNYENTQGWYFDVSWEQDGVLSSEIFYSFLNWEDKPPAVNLIDYFETRRCYNFLFMQEGLPNQSVNVRFNSMDIDSKDFMTDEDCLRVQEQMQEDYPGLEFVCDYHLEGLRYGFRVVLEQVPEGMEVVTAYQVIEDAFVQKIDADFVFDVGFE